MLIATLTSPKLLEHLPPMLPRRVYVAHGFHMWGFSRDLKLHLRAPVGNCKRSSRGLEATGCETACLVNYGLPFFATGFPLRPDYGLPKCPTPIMLWLLHLLL